MEKNENASSVLGEMSPSKAIVNLPLWRFNMGVEGASLATTISQFLTFGIFIWFYASGRSIIKIRPRFFHPSWKLVKTVTLIGIPTAVIQICLSVASSLTNIAAAGLPRDHCSLWCSTETGSDWLLCHYGIHAELSACCCFCFRCKAGKQVPSVRPVCIKGLPCFDSAGYRFLYPVCKTAYFII